MLRSNQQLALSQYLHTQGPFIIYTTILSLVNFGFALTNADISVDEEISSMLTTVHPGWLTADRWGMALINRLFLPGPVIPFFPLILAMGFNLLSLLLTLKIWQSEEGAGKYLAAVPVLTLPTIAFVYQFNLCSFGYYLGIFLAVLAVYCFIRMENIKGKLISILFMTLAVSIYQATIFTAPTIFFLYLFRSAFLASAPTRSLRSTIATIVYFMVCFISALAVNQIISLLVRSFHDISVRYHTVDDFFNGAFFSKYSLILVIKELIAFFSGHKFYIGWLNGLTICICMIILGYKIFRTRSLSVPKVFPVVLIICSVISTFALIIFTGQIWPARAMMAIPFLFGGCFLLAHEAATPKVRSFLIPLVFTTFIFNFYLNTRLFYADHIAWQRDSALAVSIGQRAELHFGDSLTSNEIPLVILGKRPLPRIPAHIQFETFGQSLFEWE